MTGALAGKIAIATGASRRIGAGIAFEFAKRGCAGIAITYLGNKAAAETTVKKIKELGADAVAIKADVEDPATGDLIVQKTLEAFKTDGIDILVNNVGFAGIVKLDDATPDDFHRNFDTHALGPIFISRAVLKVIRRGGRIIMVSSKAAKTSPGDPFLFYSASKAALHFVAKSLATGWAAEKGITVNTVMPASTQTDMADAMDPVIMERLVSQMTAEKRIGTVDDVAQVVGWLAEDGSRWVNGDVFSVTGGSWMP